MSFKANLRCSFTGEWCVAVASEVQTLPISISPSAKLSWDGSSHKQCLAPRLSAVRWVLPAYCRQWGCAS